MFPVMMAGECGSWQLSPGTRQPSMCNGRLGKADWTRMELSHGLSHELGHTPTHRLGYNSSRDSSQEGAGQEDALSEEESNSGREKGSQEMVGTNAPIDVQSTTRDAKQEGDGGSTGGVGEGKGRDEGDPSSQGVPKAELNETPQEEASGSRGLPTKSTEALQKEGAGSGRLEQHYGEPPGQKVPVDGGAKVEPDEPPRKEEATSGSAPKIPSVEEPPEEEFGCDRSSSMTDVCRLKGTVRIQTGSPVVEVYTQRKAALGPSMHVRPQPRKYDADMMAARITEFELVSKSVQVSCQDFDTVQGVMKRSWCWAATLV